MVANRVKLKILLLLLLPLFALFFGKRLPFTTNTTMSDDGRAPRINALMLAQVDVQPHTPLRPAAAARPVPAPAAAACPVPAAAAFLGAVLSGVCSFATRCDGDTRISQSCVLLHAQCTVAEYYMHRRRWRAVYTAAAHFSGGGSRYHFCQARCRRAASSRCVDTITHTHTAACFTCAA